MYYIYSLDLAHVNYQFEKTFQYLHFLVLESYRFSSMPNILNYCFLLSKQLIMLLIIAYFKTWKLNPLSWLLFTYIIPKNNSRLFILTTFTQLWTAWTIATTAWFTLYWFVRLAWLSFSLLIFVVTLAALIFSFLPSLLYLLHIFYIKSG